MTSISAAVAGAGAAAPGKVAVVDDERRLTYAELDGLVNKVADGLAARDVGPGDVVTSQLPTGAEALALSVAVNRIGAIHNPVTTIYRGRETEFIRAQARSAVFVDRPDDDLFTDFGRVPRRRRAQTRPKSGGDDLDPPRFLLYTSGSTADPKGVLHSDGTLRAECAAQAAFHELTQDDVFVTASSVGHVSGLIYGVLLPVWLGATAVLMRAWDPGRFLRLVESERATFSGGAPAFLQGLVDHPDLSSFDTSSLRVFPCGGADVDPQLIRRAARGLGVRTGRGYGSTEFPSITSGAGPGEDDDKRAECDGRPIGANEVRIVDGEIQARGPELFLGYRDASLDADAFTDDGWFRTGDLGTLDGDGYLTVTGRLKDVIVRSGEKISAREIENLLATHPKVAAVAVVARPDPRTGERACACVVPHDPLSPPTLAELCEYLRGTGLSVRKLPEQIELLAALPMTTGGKLDKQALRAPTSL